MCAYPPVQKGERYLVYADAPYHDGSEDRAWNIIWLCNRTSRIEFTLGKREVDLFEDMKLLNAATAACLSFKLDFKTNLALEAPGTKSGSLNKQRSNLDDSCDLSNRRCSNPAI